MPKRVSIEILLKQMKGSDVEINPKCKSNTKTTTYTWIVEIKEKYSLGYADQTQLIHATHSQIYNV